MPRKPLESYVLGVDGGQTSTRLAIASHEGKIVWAGQYPTALNRMRGDYYDDLHDLLLAVLTGALQEACWNQILFSCAVLGMTGAEPGSPLLPVYQRTAEEAFSAKKYVVVHDATTNLLGASAGKPGVVVIGGGGALAYGLADDGKTWTSSGWGYMVGDEGSAYNVGRAAINAVFRAQDRRDPPTALTGLILSEFRAARPVELKYAVLSKRIASHQIAGVALLVAQAAAAGDRVAIEILERAGKDLAEAGISVIRELFEPGLPVDIYLTGGLFREKLFLRPAFMQAIQAACPEGKIVPPAFPPVVGSIIKALQIEEVTIDATLIQRLARSWTEKGFGEEG